MQVTKILGSHIWMDYTLIYFLIVMMLTCSRKKHENNNENNNNRRVIPLPLISQTEMIDDYTKSKSLNFCIAYLVDQKQSFSGVRVTRSLVLYLCFVDRCLSFCTCSFGHCVVCSTSIYGFWLPLWYLQTPLIFPAILILCNRLSFPFAR
jgi:hypothetical protein